MNAPEMRYSAMAAPAVLLFADDPARSRRLAGLIAATGARLVAEGPLAGATARIDLQVGPGALVVIDVAEDGGGALDDLLTRIDAAVRTARFAAILLTPTAALDRVYCRIGDPSTAILVDADDGDFVEAVSLALVPAEARLWDDSGEANKRRLAHLKEEVGRIARSLARLSGGDEAVAALPPAAGSPTAPGDTAPSTLAVLRTMLRLRRLRGQFLEPALFADPAWDILLDLMVARLERRRVAVSSLCIAAAVPPTTALRWITTMTDQGLLVRRPDPDDGRRIFIVLAECAAAAMMGYIEAARPALRP